MDRAARDGCACLQIFTKAPAIWKTDSIDEDAAEKLARTRADLGIGPLIVHGSYLVNPCSPKQATRERSWAALAEEARRCDLLGAEFLVFHPGSPGELGEEEGVTLVAGAVKRALAESERVTLLVESTAGQGTGLGHRFEQLAAIIDGAGGSERLGACLDTCHSFAAGYDLATPGSAARVFEELDRVLGADRLKALHLNDSKKPLGSRVDRHALIGQGEIGLELFRWLVNEPRFARMPGILETPVGKGETYADEIDVLGRLTSTS